MRKKMVSVLLFVLCLFIWLGCPMPIIRGRFFRLFAESAAHEVLRAPYLPVVVLFTLFFGALYGLGGMRRFSLFSVLPACILGSILLYSSKEGHFPRDYIFREFGYGLSIALAIIWAQVLVGIGHWVQHKAPEAFRMREACFSLLSIGIAYIADQLIYSSWTSSHLIGQVGIPRLWVMLMMIVGAIATGTGIFAFYSQGARVSRATGIVFLLVCVVVGIDQFFLGRTLYNGLTQVRWLRYLVVGAGERSCLYLMGVLGLVGARSLLPRRDG